MTERSERMIDTVPGERSELLTGAQRGERQ